MRQSQSPLGFAIAEPSWFCNRRARLVLQSQSPLGFTAEPAWFYRRARLVLPQSPLGFTAALAMLVD